MSGEPGSRNALDCLEAQVPPTHTIMKPVELLNSPNWWYHVPLDAFIATET
jgi:hypothetical protein